MQELNHSIIQNSFLNEYLEQEGKKVKVLERFFSYFSDEVRAKIYLAIAEANEFKDSNKMLCKG